MNLNSLLVFQSFKNIRVLTELDWYIYLECFFLNPKKVKFIINFLDSGKQLMKIISIIEILRTVSNLINFGTTSPSFVVN